MATKATKVKVQTFTTLNLAGVGTTSGVLKDEMEKHASEVRFRELIMLWIMRAFTIKELFIFDIIKLEQSLDWSAITKKNMRSGFIPHDLVTVDDFKNSHLSLGDLEKYYMQLTKRKGLDVPEYKIHEFVKRYTMFRSIFKNEGTL